jgi:hypothetical protein
MKLPTRLGWAIAALGILGLGAACGQTSTSVVPTNAPANEPTGYPIVVPTTPAAPYPGAASTAPPPATAPPVIITPDFQLYLPLINRADATPEPIAAAPPTPEPEPTITWPEPVAGLSASKLGLHALNSGEPRLMELVRRVKPRVVKAVGDYGWLAEVKAVSPEIVTIGRIGQEQPEWISVIDPAAAGEAYIEINLEQYRANPSVDYWEGWNEFVPVEPARMRWFAQFEAARACRMQALGFRAAVGGFSVGVPEYALMGDFLPALEAARRCGGLFHLHEYNAPTFDCLVATGVPGIIPGAPALNVPAGPFGLRYRFWYEGWLKPRGLGDLPLVISELGIDGVSRGACNGPVEIGWKPYRDWWVQQGLASDGDQAHIQALAWYDEQMRRDSYVLGATIFTAGAANSGNEWYPFDLREMLVPLAYYLAGQR